MRMGSEKIGIWKVHGGSGGGAMLGGREKGGNVSVLCNKGRGGGGKKKREGKGMCMSVLRGKNC